MMKAVAINSIFILLSSTVLTTGILLTAYNDSVLIKSDNAAAVAQSQTTSFENNGSLGFLSFEDIINTAFNNTEASTTSTTSLPNNTDSTDTDAQNASTALIEPKENLGDAIVNIICIQTTDTYKRRVSGTGFFISSRGVILTNAHVGQFLLLTEIDDFGKTTCSASTGLEGAPTHNVRLLYISSAWLLEHASLINDNSPRGTGENDFALLFVTNDEGEEMPNSNFAHLPPATSPLSKDLKDDTVILVGYPKEDGAKTGKRVVATTTVTNIYTFGSGYADIFSLDSSPLGYTGASGGPVIDPFGRSIGVITTKEPGTTFLNAITMSHIDRSIKKESETDLMSILQGDLSSRASYFNETISPILQEVLIKSNE